MTPSVSSSPSASPALAPVSTTPLVLTVDLIDANPINPRNIDDRDEDEQRSLRDLGNNLVAVGQFMEVRVRPHPSVEGRFQLVDGERRWRACRLVGKTTLNCLSGAFTDEHVLVIALGSGGNQKPLNPIDRAKGYASALKLPGMSYEKLAAQTGQSVAAIERIIALVKLPKRSRRMVEAGVMSARLAWVIARVPGDDVRQKVEAAVAPAEDGTGMLSTRAAEHLIKEQFSRSLHGAPFDTEDATLLPEEGACLGCPFRAGTNKEFYGDVANPHTCMRPECFGRKASAAKAKRLAAEEASETGPKRVTLSAEENENVFPPGGDGVAAESGYIAYSRPLPADLVKPEVVAAGVPKVCDITAGLTVRLGTDQSGREVEVVPVAEVVRAVTEPEILKKEVIVRYGEPVGAASVAPKSGPAKGSIADDQAKEKRQQAAAERQAGKRRREAAEWLGLLFGAASKDFPPGMEFTMWSLIYEHHLEIIEAEEAVVVLRAVSDLDAKAPQAKSELKTFAAGLRSWQELRALCLVMIWGPSVAAGGTSEPWVVEIHRTLVAPQAPTEPVAPIKPAMSEEEKAKWSAIAKAHASGMDEREIARSWGVPLPEVCGALGVPVPADDHVDAGDEAAAQAELDAAWVASSLATSTSARALIMGR